MSASQLTVGRICHSPVLTCAPDTPVAEVARRLHASRCSSIVIQENGRPVGIWTERDALAVPLGDAAALARPIRDVMSKPVRSVPASLGLGEATMRFLDQGIRHFLVHDDASENVIVGIVSQTDVVLNQSIEYFLHLRDIRSILTRPAPPVSARLPLSKVTDMMRAGRLDAVAVEYGDGEPGILTERDMVRLVAEGRGDVTIGSVATRPLISIPASESLYTARTLLGRHNIRHLGVVDAQGWLVSLLSFADILTSIEHDYVHELRATLKDREEALALSRGKLRMAGMLFEATLEAILIADRDGIIRSANPACCRMTGFDEAELTGRPLSSLIAGRQGEGFTSALWETLKGTGRWKGELWSRHRSGEMLLNLVSISGIEEAEGGFSSYAVVFADLVSDAENAARLRFLAVHDPLTGLPNRTGLIETLERLSTTGDKHPLGLLVAGIDRFKLVNDALGYAAGDELLVAVARQIADAIPAGAVVARLGGDEFAIILDPLHGAAEAGQCATQVMDAAARPRMVDGEEIAVTVSVGIALHPMDGTTPDALLNAAHAAMARAKAAGRNAYHFFTNETDCRTRRRLSVESALRHALDRGEIGVHYQPKVHLGTMAVTGMEALARWTHPVLGEIAPSQFIPIAEEAGLIGAIGDFVLETACHQTRQWLETMAPLRVAVNLSGHQIRDPGLARKVAAMLERTGLPTSLLELEITETVAMSEVEFTLAQLAGLAEQGISLSIDDFGTGYSSFAYLRRFPLHQIKIDRSFIVAIDEDDRAAAIPAAIVSMAHTLGLSVVAEGIESARHLECLVAVGCDEGQGYHFSRPLAPDAFQSFCRASAMNIGFPPTLCLCAE